MILHGIRAIVTYVFFFPMASSSSSTSVVNTTTSSSPTSLTTIHHLITIKLTGDNYLLWKAQIVPYLKGQHLFGYLDGSTPAPSQSLTVETDGDIQVIQNPNFSHWYFQDQMILSAIISSLLERILAHVVKFNTSRDVVSLRKNVYLSVKGSNNANPLSACHFEERQFLNC